MDEIWKQSIEDKLDNIYIELTDGPVRKGLYSLSKQNTDDIRQLKAVVDEDHEVVEDIRAARKWGIRAIGAGILFCIGKFLLWIIELIRYGWWKAAPLIGELFSKHNNNV